MADYPVVVAGKQIKEDSDKHSTMLIPNEHAQTTGGWTITRKVSRRSERRSWTIGFTWLTPEQKEAMIAFEQLKAGGIPFTYDDPDTGTTHTVRFAANSRTKWEPMTFNGLTKWASSAQQLIEI